MSGNKVLRRNVFNKVIGGVCSGLADYFEIDVALIRAIFCRIIFLCWSRRRIVSHFMFVHTC